MRIICVACEKSKQPEHISKEEIFLKTWNWLLNRFNTTLFHKNFPKAGSINNGIVVSDQTNIDVIQKELRKMRKYNPVSNVPEYGDGYRNLVTANIIEDVFERESKTSYFVQAADTVSYVFRQHFEPNKYMKSKGGKNLYRILLPLIPKVVTRKSEDGIIWLS